MTLTIENLQEIAKTETDSVESYRYRINVCVAAGCLSCRSDAVKASLEEEIRRQGKEKECRVRGVGCLGLCAVGPLIDISPSNVAYQAVQPSDAPEIIGSLAGAPVSRLLLPVDQPFFSRQKKIVLENCGIVEPERIESYIAAGGYEALYQALRQMSPRQVIDEVTASGLRGRGGAGFPTGLKWTTVYKAQQANKYVVCNADEGDPGAFMDRSVLESDPHRVIEGMAIAGYAVGAFRGYIYVRAEYPLAIERLRRAIKQAKQLGILGENIFNTPFAFDIQLRLGAGAFVCGEETALIASIEGRLGRPRPRPPFPAEFGLWGCPTLINNVETFANIAPIVSRGGGWFAGIGTEKSKGTKVFALAGKINKTGLIEVPMGTTLREIVFDIGGGIPAGRRFKAVQTGGPSGGCVPEQFLDMPVDYESLKEVGSIMGSGGMIVMDDGACMVDVAKFFMEFCMSESCGKCVPCRVGTAQLFNILERITAGDGRVGDIDTLKELCDLVGATSLCGLGQTAPNPVKSTLRYFEDEYTAHIRRRHCDAGVCAMGNAREAIT
ncbi:NADH-quinone oxidoreductase subunit NuoF [uncultured Desulfosarcina sp.]|uniref:NADH-quinone oxidoreductase subunit NuoF n=1 Tax=uncultured Desulfosarcina sp. TaxID=218289 RepID=UPI0029C72B1D|nr:NADH-quinone oxidoreductase subunit NuoF [uncultured Desulfosarcina sp.]